MSVTGLQIVTDALLEIGIVNAVDPPTAEDADLGLRTLNRIVDSWNADRGMVLADAMASYSLVPATSPHTLGPVSSSPTWTIASRPVDLLAANVVVGVQRSPLAVYKGIAQWASHGAPTMTNAVPSEVSYVPGWPLASLYFWPIPTTAYVVELYSRIELVAFSLAGAVTLPPGYQDAYTLTLAEALAAPFGQAARLSGMTVQNAKAARDRVLKANRTGPPRIQTRDAGIPSDGATAPTWPPTIPPANGAWIGGGW